MRKKQKTARFLFFIFSFSPLFAFSFSFAQDSLKPPLVELKADSYNNAGNVYKAQGNYPDALKNYFASLNIYKAIGQKSGMAASYNNIGTAYYHQGNYSDALKNYFVCLKILETTGDKPRIANCYNNIGNVYDAQSNYPEALKNHLASLRICEITGNKPGIANSYNNIGNIYFYQGNYSEALKNYFASLKIREVLGDKTGIADSYNNIGNIYSDQGNYPEALNNHFASLKIEEAAGDKAGIAISHLNIGNVLIKQKRYKEAEEYLVKAKKLAIEIGEKENLKDDYISLTAVDSAKGDFRGAYENYKLYILYRDSLDNEETRKRTIQAQMTYDFEKKEGIAKAEQAKKDAITIEEKRRQKIIIYSVSGGLLSVLLLALFIFRGYRQTQKTNIIITQQKEEVERQKEITDEQKKIVEEKNKDIMDSITYAKRIQEAILIPESEIKKQFSDAFVLFNPKDIVSGDFYWFAESKYNKLIVMADCTGHGVPGGFMSILGFSMLQETLLLEDIKTTSEALISLDKKITETLNRNSRSYRDGMDMALCAFSKSSGKLQFSCANRPLILIRNGEVKKFAPDKYTIGGAIDNVSKDFCSHEIETAKGDLIYLFSDGYTDQFGGPKGKSFKYKQLEKVLLANYHLPMNDQKKVLEKTYHDWKGSLEQIDDVCIIGIRL